jgi:hypothetical protein
MLYRDLFKAMVSANKPWNKVNNKYDSSTVFCRNTVNVISPITDKGKDA